MINLLGELAIIILICGLVSISLIGWGLATVRVLNLPTKHFYTGQFIFIGFSSVLLMANLWHWFIPINWLMSIIICVSGLGFVIFLGSTQLKSSTSCFVKKITEFPLLSLTGVLLVLLFATKVFEPNTHGDAGLYHLPTISWLNQYPTVAGLGNLHFRLAFNQSYFSFAALLNIYPIWNHGYAFANFYLLIITILSVAQSIASQRHHKNLVSILLLILFANILQTPLSTAPDFTIFLFQINIFILAFQLFKAEDTDSGKSLANLVTLALLATTCITVKLSSVIFCLSILAIVVVRYRRLLVKNNSVLLRTTLFCCAVLFNHAAISYVLSGYPLYPSSLGSRWSAFWGIPLESVKREQDWIYSWARLPDALPQTVLQDWSWFKPWLHSLPAAAWLPILMAGLLFCGLAIRGYYKQTVRYANRELYILYAPLLAALLFWFLTAPDARFIGAVPSLILFLSSYLFIATLKTRNLQLSKRTKALLAVSGVLCLIVIVMYSLHLGTGLGLIRLLHLQPLIKAVGAVGINQQFIILACLSLLMVCYPRFARNVHLPYLFSATLNLAITVGWFLAAFSYMGLKMPLASAWAIPPNIEARVFTTDSGLILRTPIHGDACWLVPLPCTPYFDKNLKQLDLQLSEAIKFSNGFMTTQPTSRQQPK